MDGFVTAVGKSTSRSCSRSHFRNWARTVPHTIKYSRGCIVCELLLPATMYNRNAHRLHVAAYSYGYFEPWVSLTVPGAQDSVVLGINTVGDASWYTIKNPNTVFCTITGNDSDGLYKPRLVQAVWNHLAARPWMQTCLQCHDKACNKKSPKVAGMNLIDCIKMNIVRRSSSSRWLALSYVWGT